MNGDIGLAIIVIAIIAGMVIHDNPGILPTPYCELDVPAGTTLGIYKIDQDEKWLVEVKDLNGEVHFKGPCNIISGGNI